MNKFQLFISVINSPVMYNNETLLAVLKYRYGLRDSKSTCNHQFFEHYAFQSRWNRLGGLKWLNNKN